MKFYKIAPIFFAIICGSAAHTFGQQVISTNNGCIPDAAYLNPNVDMKINGVVMVPTDERVAASRLSEMRKTPETEVISWSGVGSGLSANGTAISVSGSDVYVGGDFSAAGGSPANCIAKWNGNSWTALGGGLNSGVLSIAVSGSDVYVGGSFSTAGGSSADYIAKWNGSSWSALGSGLGWYVRAIAVSGSDVYVGGEFTTAGGNAANYIAKWDGSNWSALGSGMNSYIYAVAVSGSDVYVGGNFTVAGGSPANYIAKWNGSSWSALGSGLNGTVRSIAVSGSDVYVGGTFSTAGGGAAVRIAKWNGSSWSALGSGLNGTVMSIAVSGSDVYAGGFFTAAGGSPANYIAKWNGSSWSALGGGTNQAIWALCINASVGTMLVGGIFSMVDGSVNAQGIASFTDSQNPLPVELTFFKAYSSGEGIHLRWHTATELNNYGFNVERTFTKSNTIGVMQFPNDGVWQSVGFVTGHGTSNIPQSYSFYDHSVGESGWYYYRLKQLDRDGSYSYSQVVEVNISSPQITALYQNYPNPIFPTSNKTVIYFSLDKPGHASLEIYNNIGVKVITLFDGELSAGEHKVPVNIDLPAGCYMYSLRTPVSVLSRRMVVYR